MKSSILAQQSCDEQWFGLSEKVAFLEKGSSYGSKPVHVEKIETHMAWVFLAGDHAWKLKKPIRTRYLNFASIEMRRRDCLEEVRINKRLAPDVYLNVVPLVVGPESRLHLGGAGSVIDWLVQMRRLPRDRMLDKMIQSGSATRDELQPVAERLAQFYLQAPPVRLTPSEYCDRLEASIRENEQDLRHDSFQISESERHGLALAQLRRLQHLATLLERRVETGHIIEAHGDLRPEHICIEPLPVIIDRLEFNRELRILDTVSELAFLGLECDRLGAPWIGPFFLEAYFKCTGDEAPADLLTFHRT